MDTKCASNNDSIYNIWILALLMFLVSSVCKIACILLAVKVKTELMLHVSKISVACLLN